MTQLPHELRTAVLGSSSSAADMTTKVAVQGFDFDAALSEDTRILQQFLASYATMGFQGSNLHEAIAAVSKMLQRRRHIAEHPEEFDEGKQFRLFLGYTSNMVSCGNRECIRFLVQHRLVDVVVSTAGGIEEDFIKCMAPTLLLGEKRSDAELRRAGGNRIGNLLVPNGNYCAFEDWLMPILDTMLAEQASTSWTPSKMIHRLGLEINDDRSIYYWAAKNAIPVFCPALTDGSLGDMLFFHSFKHATALKLDIVEDVRAINLLAMRAAETGMLVLGGGVVKHHIANANLMRNGADHAVFINTGHEWDGSDSGASPEEAVSWGKIKVGVKAVKVCADASIVFPMVLAGAFLPEVRRRAGPFDSVLYQ